jgi:hypothetical protein
MAELADLDTSEIIQANQAKSKETATLVAKLEVRRYKLYTLLLTELDSC